MMAVHEQQRSSAEVYAADSNHEKECSEEVELATDSKSVKAFSEKIEHIAPIKVKVTIKTWLVVCVSNLTLTFSLSLHLPPSGFLFKKRLYSQS